MPMRGSPPKPRWEDGGGSAERSMFKGARMDRETRENLAARLLAFSDDSGTFLEKLQSAVEYYRVKRPEVAVTYQNLCVTTQALVGAAAIPTVGNVPINFFKSISCISKGREEQELKILNNVNGVLRPGRMTLLLGPPSCGKSTLLKVLCGRLKAANMQVSGEVRYNGRALDEFHVQQTTAYVDQMDNHNGYLTVEETLLFAFCCQMGLHGLSWDLPGILRRAKQLEDESEGRGGNNDHAAATTGNRHPSHDASTAPSAAAALEMANHRQQGLGNQGQQGDAGDKLGRVPRSEGSSADAVDAFSHAVDGSTQGGAGGEGGDGGTGGSRSPANDSGPIAGVKGGREKEHGNEAVWQEIMDTLRQTWGTDVRVSVVMHLLGLIHCQETLVGDQMVRGISGGERKRLSSAEMLVGPRRILFMDEISTGLDSATLYSVIRWLGQSVRASRQTCLISLLQPPPETFLLFDDVMMIAEGRIIYHGPVPDVLPFFRDLGFECPQRKDIPSFLLEVTTPAGQHKYATTDLLITRAPSCDSVSAERNAAPAEKNFPSEAALQPPQAVPSKGASTELPRPELSKTEKRKMLVSIDEMVDAFWGRNPHGRAMLAELADPGAAEKARVGAPDGLVYKPYALSPLEAVWVTTKRQGLLLLRDRVLLRGRMAQTIVLSLITGSLFYMLPITAEGSRSFFGASFMSVLFLAFGGFPQLPVTIQMKSVFYKHRDNFFIPAYAQGIAMALVQLPLTVLECALFSLIMYFMIGFYRSASYFFTFYVVAMGVSTSVSSIFRFLGCVCPNMVIANAFGGLSLVLLIVTSGFVIVRTSIPPWMIWAYYISPFSYGLRSLVINEMTSPQWQVPTPGDPSQTLGTTALLSFGFFTETYWIWAGVGYMFGIFIVMTIGCSISLTLQNPEIPRAQLPDETQIAEARAKADAERRKLLMHKLASKRRSNMSAGKLDHLPGGGALGSLKGQNNAAGGGLGSARWGTSAYGPASPQGARSAAAAAAPLDIEAGGGGGTPSLLRKQAAAAVAEAELPPDVSEALGDVDMDDLHMQSTLPFQRVSLAFRELRYFVPNPTYSRRAAQAARAAAAKAAAARGAAPLDAEMAVPAAGTEGAKTAASALHKGAAAGADIHALEELELLKGVTGYAEPRVLTALMGGSGAGKTTLMDVIAGRKTIGKIQGDIFVNGHPKEQRSWSRIVGYCEQFDVHSPAQTVREALLFSARLRLPASVTKEQATAYVNEVLDIVDMMDIMYNLVGTPGVNGLSVEQRKRLTIGVELVSNPSVVFMDEPTSGLDARAAATVMRAVRNVALNGRTVMVTIHQPSIEIFEAFDMLLLIQRGGRVSYFGSLGKSSDDLISYLRRIPSTPALPPGYNPATWMLEVTGGSMATMVDKVDIDWPAVYAASDLCRANAEYVDLLVERDGKQYEPLAVQSKYAQSFGTQSNLLLHKFHLAYWRSPGYNFSRLSITLLVSLLYGTTYYRQGIVQNPSSIANIQNVMGIMFSSSNFVGMTNLMSAMAVIGYERIVFYREQGSSMYDAFAYGYAIAMVEVPYLIVQSLLFVPIMYWMVMFKATPEAFFQYLLIFFETICFYTIFGQFLVYITPNQAVAQVIGAMFNFLFNIFNGFVITYPAMPSGWHWMNRISPPTWILYGLGIMQLGDSQNLVQAPGADPDNLPTVAEFMPTYFGYSYSLRWWCALILAAYILFVRITSILALKYLNFLKR